MKKVVSLVGIIFISVGIFTLMMFKLFIFNFNTGIDNPKETMGHITRIDDEDVYVLYTVDGVDYERKTNFYSSNMSVGDKIKIVYEQDNPKKFNLKVQEYLNEQGGIFKYIFYIVPGIFILIGLLMISISIINKMKIKKLLNSGLLIMAKISSVDYNSLVNINGKHPYIIKASFTYNNLVYESKSEDIWFDVKYVLDTFGITEVPIYIDPENPKNNIIDIKDIKSKLGK